MLDTRTEDKKRVDKEVKLLEFKCKQKTLWRDKRDTRFNVIYLSVNLILLIISLINGAYLAAFVIVTYSFWTILVWLKDRQINRLKLTIDLLQGLHVIERNEVERILRSEETIKPAKRKK